jgi:hypothetical protein
MTKEFTKLRAEAFLQKGAEELKQHDLADAETSYQQALAALNTATIRKRVRRNLETYLEGCIAAQKWSCAETALTMLRNLSVADEDALVPLRDNLFKLKAWDKLKQGQLEAAFECLKHLSDEAHSEFKTLVRAHVQHRAHQGQWVAGYAALKRLVDQLPDDDEAIFWRANWLFSWAQALFPEEKRDRKPLRAKCLCLRILDLDIAPLETPIINLLVDDASPAQKDVPNLRQHVCTLLTDILLEQVQTCLSEGNLAESERHFQTALALPVPPERQLLVTLAKDQLRFSLKAERPDQAFTLLNHLKIKLENREREEIKSIVHQFSRLYAGREGWEAAQQALRGLHEWLTPSGQEEIVRLIDSLNREWLDFVRAKRKLATQPTQEDIKRREEEREAAKVGYRDARALELDTQDVWAEDFVQACLALGQAYLANNDLDLAGAVQPYQEILDEESHRLQHEYQICQSLHSYCARMLDQEDWDDAWQAMDYLKGFDLVAPDGQTQPDLRVDGAMQWVILRQGQALLDADDVQETFAQLRKKLPPPWPVGKIKQMIWDYSKEPQDEREWANALAALKALVNLLNAPNEQVRDQEAMQRLVNGLADYGSWLEDKMEMSEAADIYKQALQRTRETTQPRSAELADHYIEVTRRLARGRLKEDLQTTQTPRAIDQTIPWHRRVQTALRMAPDPSQDERQALNISNALQEAAKRYQEILEVPEHNTLHERSVNEDLRDHAIRLAEAGQWQRAHQALNRLNNLYGEKPKYATQFAGWRRDLVLVEIQPWLKEEQPGEAFERLEGLKAWLDSYDAPGASWLDNASEVKGAYRGFYEDWLEGKRWELAVPASRQLVSLLPEDKDVNGWLVRALFQEGQALDDQKAWAEALNRYQEALKIAGKQKTVPESDIEGAALKNRLAQAQQHLNAGDLSAGVDVYAQAFQLPGDHPQRADEIRRTLIQYGDFVIEQRTPPGWEIARQVLTRLMDLQLYNDQVLEWHQNLILREMKDILWQKNAVGAAFAKLADLPDPWPLGGLQQLVEDYSEDRAKAGASETAIEALKRLGDSLSENKAASQRVAAKLIALGERLSDLGNYADAELAYDASVNILSKYSAQ